MCGDSRVCDSVVDSAGVQIGPQGASSWLYSHPPGIRGLLGWVWKRYQAPIVVTENGFDVRGESALPINEALQDQARVDYLRGYLDNVQLALEVDGVDVRGYHVWSLLDNFEWADGYSCRFGIHYVDYTSPARARYPKRSAQFYSKAQQHERVSAPKIAGCCCQSPLAVCFPRVRGAFAQAILWPITAQTRSRSPARPFTSTGERQGGERSARDSGSPIGGREKPGCFLCARRLLALTALSLCVCKASFSVLPHPASRSPLLCSIHVVIGIAKLLLRASREMQSCCWSAVFSWFGSFLQFL